MFLALLDWRNTPAEQLGQSPAQLLFNRRTRTSLPTASPLLDASTSSAANIALTAAKAKQAYYYNKGAMKKPPLAVGQTVRMKFDDKSEWRKGEVTDVLPYRSYNIKTEDGTVRRRNARHVRFSAEPPLIFTDDEPDNSTSTSSSRARPVSVTTGVHLSSGPTSRHIETNLRTKRTVITRSGRLVRKPARFRET